MQIIHKIPSLALVTTMLLLSSCGAMFTKMYGIKKVTKVDERRILKWGKKYNIPPEASYQLDTCYYIDILSRDTTAAKKAQIKNHYQPLQALYYNNTQTLQSFHINCFAGGFPNINWNRNGNFDVFPPKQQAPLDSLLPLNIHFNYIHNLTTSDSLSYQNTDYLVIVHWSRMMGRQSKRFIKFVQNNSQLAQDESVKIIYVNNDLAFLNLE